MNIKDFSTGVQHIGIPTNNIEETINFYLTLGFEVAFFVPFTKRMLLFIFFSQF